MSNNRWRQHRSLFSKSFSPVKREKRRKWVVISALWKLVKRTAMVVGFTVLLSSVLMGIFLERVINNEVQMVPDQAVLHIEMHDTIVDRTPNMGLSGSFLSSSISLQELIDAIDHARYDERIQGIVLHFKGGYVSSANAQEIRYALANFKAAGKFLWVYATNYGGVGAGLGTYYLASIFDEIWMQPMGAVFIPGLRAEVPYVRDVLDQVGIEPQFFQRKDYKTIYESVERSEMSEENRMMLRALIGDMEHDLTTDIARDRGMSEEAFRSLIDYGLFTADEALKVGLITKNNYGDVLIDALRVKLNQETENQDEIFVNLEDYIADINMQSLDHKNAFPVREKQGRVALIYVSGAIMEQGAGNGSIAASEEIAPAILESMNDKDIDAIVLRVDSPGGTPVAAERILRALDLAQRKGKLVVVSMGSVAASGGYWVAAHADQIFALPTTTTGSIGVVGGKVSMAEMWNKVGVNWDQSVKWGKNSAMSSLNTPFTQNEAERFNMMLDHTYASFLSRVAKGRKMSIEDVDKVAGGRVWSGRKAQEIGLVDQLGGLNDALNYVALELGFTDRYDLEVEILPKPKNPIEELMAFLEGESGIGDLPGVSAIMRLITWIKPFLTQMDMMMNAQKYSVYESLQVH